MFIQLIRTTYWTRFEDRKRADEIEQVELSLESEQALKITKEVQNGIVHDHDKGINILLNLYSLEIQ